MEVTESVGLMMVQLEIHSWDCLMAERPRDRSALGWMFEVYEGGSSDVEAAGRDPRLAMPAVGTTLLIVTGKNPREKY